MRYWPFNRKQKKADNLAEDKTAFDEVEVHKRVTKRKVEEVKKASEKLNRVLKANGFTLKIYLAAGGTHPASHRK